MKTTIARLLALLIVLLFAGCLEFDSQEVVFRYDREKDQIDVLLVYRGLFAESSGDDDSMKKALKDLEETMQSGEFAFWCNWPFSVDLSKDVPAPITALLAHVDVENGVPFTDPTGLLCGYQFVRVREAKAFLEKLNVFLELAVQAGIARGFDGHGPDHKVDDDSKDLIREFMRSGEKLLVVDGNRIEVRLPASQPDLAWALGQIEQYFILNVAREVVDRLPGVEIANAGNDEVAERNRVREAMRAAPSFRFFWDNAFTIDRQEGLMTIGIGSPDAAALRIHKASDGKYKPSLLEVLRERGDKIEDGVPDQEIERRFEAFRERQAVLPAKVAELRAR